MPELTICEGVGADLQPDDNRVDFGDGANEGMVDMVVDD